MVKRKSKKYNKLLTARQNYFDDGGGINWGNPFKSGAAGGGFAEALNSGSLNGAATAVGGMIGGAISGGLESGAGNVIGGLADVASAIPGPWGAVAGAGLKLVGGLTNAAFGSKLNQENIAAVEASTARANSTRSDASDYDTLTNTMSNTAGVANFTNSYIGKDGWFSNKAKNKAAALREQARVANERQSLALISNAEDISSDTLRNLEANYAAYGGHLFSRGGGIHIKPENRGKFNALKKRTGKTTEELTHSKNPLTRKRAIFAQNAKKWKHADGGNLFDDGGYTWQDGIMDAASFLPIVGTAMDAYEFYKEPSWENAGYLGLSLLSEIPFLKPLRGVKGFRTINKVANKVGNKVMKATTSPYSPKSNFHKKAVDINNWLSEYYSNPFVLSDTVVNSFQQGKDTAQKAFGGELGTNGADFTNGIIEINSGGTHEQNPNEGVIFGVDQEGIPNLVEEGEVVFGDYVFSNRIKVPKTVRKKHRLTDGVTFADAAKELAKESEERPNDPISQNGLEYLMNDLMTEQEMIKAKGEKNKFSKGGRVNKYSDGTSNLGLTFPNIAASIDMDPIVQASRIKDQADLFTRTHNYRLGQKEAKDRQMQLANLRYVPALGAAIGVTTDLLGLTNKPDYEPANMVLEAGREASTAPSVRFNPIGNYLTYTPFDRNYYINRLNAEAGASRRALSNSGMSSGARAAAILAGDNNYLNQLGSLARQAEEYNLAQRQQVENFNRATNQYNSEGALKADIANAENRLKTANLRMESTIAGAKMRQAAKDASDLARSTNLTNLFDSLGNIGWEEYQRNAIESNPALSGYYQSRTGNVGYNPKRAKGGFLTIKKRRK